MGLDQREVGANGIFQHVMTAVDLAGFLSLGEQGAVTRWREERTKARAAGLDPRRQIALRNQLQLDLPRLVKGIEHVGIGLARKRADDLAHAFGREQRSEACLPVARAVVHDGEILRALGDQRVDQLGRHAGGAKAADHHGCPVENIGDRSLGRADNFVDHRLLRRDGLPPRVFDYRTIVRYTGSAMFCLLSVNVKDGALRSASWD